MAFGPVFRYELITTSRRPRYYLLRFTYGLLLLYALSAVTRYQFDRYPGDLIGPSELTVHWANRIAEQAFLALGWAQWVALLAVVPAMTAGVIADAKRRLTLRDLLASGLSARAIVLGKLGARFVQVGTFVLLGVPIAAIVATFGIIDPWLFVAVYGGSAAMILALGGVSILVSTLARRPREAILAAYGLEFVWLAVIPILGTLVQYMAWPINLLDPALKLLVEGHPLLLWSQINQATEVTRQSLYGNPFRAPWATTFALNVYQTVLYTIAMEAVLGLACILLAVLALRRFGAGEGSPAFDLPWKRRPRRSWSPVLWERPECGEEPMLWKERYASPRGGLSWLLSRPLGLFLGVLLGCTLFDIAWPAFAEAWGGRPSNAVTSLNDFVRQVAFYVSIAWLLAVASAAAVSLTSEREDDTWTSLTATLLTGREVVAAKVLGALWAGRWMGGALGATVLVGVLGGAIHALGAVVGLTVLLAAGVFASALGVSLSMDARTSTRAMVTTLFASVVLGGGLLLGPSLALGTFQAHGLNSLAVPFLVATSLVSPGEVQLLWQGGLFRSWFDQAGYGPELIPMVISAVVLFLLATLILTGAASEAYERVAGRARRATTAGLTTRRSIETAEA